MRFLSRSFLFIMSLLHIVLFMFIHRCQLLLYIVLFTHFYSSVNYILIYEYPIKKFTNNVLNLPGVKTLGQQEASFQEYIKAYFFKVKTGEIPNQYRWYVSSNSAIYAYFFIMRSVFILLHRSYVINSLERNWLRCQQESSLKLLQQACS